MKSFVILLVLFALPLFAHNSEAEDTQRLDDKALMEKGKQALDIFWKHMPPNPFVHPIQAGTLSIVRNPEWGNIVRIIRTENAPPGEKFSQDSAWIYEDGKVAPCAIAHPGGTCVLGKIIDPSISSATLYYFKWPVIKTENGLGCLDAALYKDACEEMLALP